MSVAVPYRHALDDTTFRIMLPDPHTIRRHHAPHPPTPRLQSQAIRRFCSLRLPRTADGLHGLTERLPADMSAEYQP